MTADPIADLRDLLTRATAGPWRRHHYEFGGPREYARATDSFRTDARVILLKDADAALIVAAVNALPTLLDIAEAARAYLDTSPAQTGRVSEERLRAALARFDGADE
jgi:hypothetical protein